MARRRRRRSYRDMVAIPGLSQLDVLGYNVNASDVFVGLAIGLVGGGLVKAGLAKLAASGTFQVPAMLQRAVPVLAAGAAGAAAFYGQKKSGRSKGHLVGALAAGLALTGQEVGAASGLPGFADTVSVNMGYSPYGVFVDERTPGLHGLIIDEPRRQLAEANLADISAVIGDGDYDSVVEAEME